MLQRSRALRHYLGRLLLRWAARLLLPGPSLGPNVRQRFAGLAPRPARRDGRNDELGPQPEPPPVAARSSAPAGATVAAPPRRSRASQAASTGPAHDSEQPNAPPEVRAGLAAVLRAKVRAMTTLVRVGRGVSIDTASKIERRHLRGGEPAAPPSGEPALSVAPKAMSSIQSPRPRKAPRLLASAAPPPGTSRASEALAAKGAGADDRRPSLRADVAATKPTRPLATRTAPPRADGRPVVSAGEGEDALSMHVAAVPREAPPFLVRARPQGRPAAMPRSAAARPEARPAGEPFPAVARVRALSAPAPTPLPEPALGRRDEASRTSFAAGAWPSLPDEPKAAAPTRWPALPDEDSEPHASAPSGRFPYDRAMRLRREQRGEPWSA